ncbi:MAG: NAD(P)H-dependent glycerol-3-phosphate dehydrogenase [Peptostreptococcus sp.]|uniref:NAD(P)H-dependent glycerol-3-phosphate dehydrogenase n=1 Tax=Peptostreptococcus sp. TaxID=1262 RepID=UPI002FCC7345
MNKVCVLGAGSWATALAKVLNDNGNEVILWARRQEQCDEINNCHTNKKYLDGIVLDEKLKATADLKSAIEGAKVIVLAVPSQQVRGVCQKIKSFASDEQIIVNVAKGIENKTGKRISQICLKELPNNKYCMLSGPSHAEEVSRNIPTAVVAASECIETSQIIQDYFMNKYFRVYTNHDLVGVELGGATKNIIAFGAGILDGLNYGDNSKAALMTRGLTEISKFGVAMGAELSTFSGLSGIGDLIVTCTSMHSRNRRAGILVGKGHSIEETKKEIEMVVEGITATVAVYEMAEKMNIEMPITECIYRVITTDLDPEEGVMELMTRSKKHENESIFKL